MPRGFFAAKRTNSSSKALLWVTEYTAKRPLSAAAAGSQRAPGAWVNTGQSSQHKPHTGLCKAAVGHLATSQCSVPALWATTAVSLRIEVAGLNPTACCRNADCGEMSRKTGNAARERKKEKRSVPVARLEKIETESEREMRKSWPRTKRLRMCYWVDSKICPYKVIMCMRREGHKNLWFQFMGCLCDINDYFHVQ